MKALTVECPECKKKFNYYISEFRPFCSERCKLIDLGQWLCGISPRASRALMSVMTAGRSLIVSIR